MTAVLMRQPPSDRVSFFCPGCQESHTINTTWQITGTDERPTVAPSVLMMSGHYAPGHKPGSCWCTYKLDHPGEWSPTCRRCHSFIRDGQIQFLSDCSHALAGQTVSLPPYPTPGA